MTLGPFPETLNDCLYFIIFTRFTGELVYKALHTVCHARSETYPFTCNVVIDIVGFMSAILIFVLYISCLFLSYSSFFSPFFCIK